MIPTLDVDNPMVRAILEKEGITVPDMTYDIRCVHSLLAACKRVESLSHLVLASAATGARGYSDHHEELRLAIGTLVETGKNAFEGFEEWSQQILTMIEQIQELQSRQEKERAEAQQKQREAEGHTPN